jgi:hypothetical protein
MTKLHRAAIALLAAAALAGGAARGATTTNFSDQWWVEAEAGWGASVLQQADVLFIDLFVYGSDTKATWFTAAAAYQSASPAGHTVFSGDLYQTTGPYFGGAFNPSAVGYRRVGTLTFDATDGNSARLTYTVDGTPVAKNVTRQLWRYENLSGEYYGGDSVEQTQCGSDNGHYTTAYYISIAHGTDNAVTMTLREPASGDVFTITGTYTQSGHMGQVAGTVSSNLGLSGPARFFEIERTTSGITGRVAATLQGAGGSCTIDGRLGGVRR